MTDFWTDERIKQMLELLRAGWTAREVATVLGTSKNAIVGKCRRLRYTIMELNKNQRRRHGTHVPIGRTAPAVRKATTMSKPKAQIVIKLRAPRPRPMKPIEPPKPPAPAVPQELPQTCCDIFHLTDHTCRWPMWPRHGVDPKLYCGAPVSGKTYCEDHWGVAIRGIHEKRLPRSSLKIRITEAKLPKSMLA